MVGAETYFTPPPHFPYLGAESSPAPPPPVLTHMNCTRKSNKIVPYLSLSYIDLSIFEIYLINDNSLISYHINYHNIFDENKIIEINKTIHESRNERHKK